MPFWAEVELENLSLADLEIEYEMAVLQYLNLIVHDARGAVVSDHHFGDRFSPMENARLLRLRPGEKFLADVHLLATMPRGPIAPGKYTVHAVYEYNGFRAESEAVEVTVKPPVE